MTQKPTKTRRSKASKTREFHAIFYLSYPVFLVAALVGRLAPASEPRHGLNVFAEAREMANTIIPFAFMH
ncbi:MAG: hypothetical protein AAF526_07685 [Pseudomonadota bacterium]